MFQITGFEQLTSLFEGLSDAMRHLKGKLCEARFDPSNPEQVQAAIYTMQEAVDARLSEFPANPLLQQFATGIKENIRAEILNRASEARRRLTVNGIPFDLLNAPALLGSTPALPSKAWSRSHRRRGGTI